MIVCCIWYSSLKNLKFIHFGKLGRCTQKVYAVQYVLGVDGTINVCIMQLQNIFVSIKNNKFRHILLQGHHH
jgi:hypothetical protein